QLAAAVPRVEISHSRGLPAGDSIAGADGQAWTTAGLGSGALLLLLPAPQLGICGGAVALCARPEAGRVATADGLTLPCPS
ncbi:MAG: hypothetical protein ACRDHW_06215, partial [Ktedonobacteraceae bacterium]